MNNGSTPANPTNAITNLTATYDPNTNAVTLSWSGSFSQPVTYVVTRVSTNGADETVPVGQTTSQTITDTSVQPNETYIYTVEATSQATGQTVGKPASVTVTTSARPAEPRQRDQRGAARQRGEQHHPGKRDRRPREPEPWKHDQRQHHHGPWQ